MLNFNSVMLSSENYKDLAAFYGKVFDKKPEMEDDGYTGYLVGSCFLSIASHDKVKGKNKNPERSLLNFETTDVKGEFERIKKVEGIEVIAEPYSMGEDNKYWIATFADPDGNYFQLVSPWDDSQN